MQVATEEVFEIGHKLGYSSEDVQAVIDRRGTAAAHRHLKAKLTEQERFVSREHEKRLAAQASERARARHAKTRNGEREARRFERERMTLPQRLAACLETAALMPCADGVGVAGGGVSSGKKESAAPTAAPNDVVDFHLPRLRALISSFEFDLDAEELGAEGTRETADERDRRIVRDYEGFASYEVATFDRSVGSPDTVERARRKHGRLPAKGYRPPEAVVA